MGDSKGGGGDTVMEVPFTMIEWNLVRNKFMSNKPYDIQMLLDMFAMWKSRMYEKVPIAISCSEVILRVALQDAKMYEEAKRVPRNVHGELSRELTYVIDHFEETKSLYAHALIRFISYVVDIVQGQDEYKKVFAKQAVRKFGIPEWIVDVRNHCTHQITPSIEKLRDAVNFIRKWINIKWWNRPYTHSLDNPFGRSRNETPRERRERKICETVQKFANIQMAKFQGKCVQREDIVEANKLVEDMSDYIIVDSKMFLRCLVREGCLIFSAGQQHILMQNVDTDEVIRIPLEIQKVWKDVFQLIISHDMTGQLIIILLECLKESAGNANVAGQYRAWIILLLDASSDARLEYGITQAEWRNILKEALALTAELPAHIFEGIISRIDKNSDRIKEKVRQFVNITTTISNNVEQRQMHLHADEKYIARSVEDLQKELKNDLITNATHSNSAHSAPGNSASVLTKSTIFKRCDPDLWRNIPSGLCPGQSFDTFTLIVCPVGSMGGVSLWPFQSQHNANRKRKIIEEITLDDD